MAKIRLASLALGALVSITSTSGGAGTGADSMSAAAQSFLETLDEGQRAIGVMPIDADERGTWSNLPMVMVQPAGILVGDMNDAQRRALHSLMRATMSSQGYAKLSGIMLLDDLLHEIDAQRLALDEERRDDPMAKAIVATRSYGNYAVAVFGSPDNENWGWKITGHHAAANFTVSNGQVGFTPTFLGSNPMVVKEGRYAGLRALAHEGQRGIDLMNALDDTQARAATIAPEAVRDIFEGPGRRKSLESFEGLSSKDLDSNQMRLLRRLVDEYLHNANHDAVDAQIAAIEAAGWNNLWFSWRGPVDPNGVFYYRVHGPRILIEYNRQDDNHDHSVVRDPANDYGEDWLGRHYEEDHPTMDEIQERLRQRTRPESDNDSE